MQLGGREREGEKEKEKEGEQKREGGAGEGLDAYRSWCAGGKAVGVVMGDVDLPYYAGDTSSFDRVKDEKKDAEEEGDL